MNLRLPVILAAAFLAVSFAEAQKADLVATPAAVSAVTTPGGTTGFVPYFTGTASIANSILRVSPTGLGVGHTPGSSFSLDVKGRALFNGELDLANLTNASTTAGGNSNSLRFNFQVYNSASKKVVSPYLQLQAEARG